MSVEDGNDIAAIDEALAEARDVDSAPTFIRLRTTIGYGAPGIEGTSKAHGSPLGADAIAAMRARFDWPDSPFYVPAQVRYGPPAAFAIQRRCSTVGLDTRLRQLER